jgi:hypothetical protein
MEDKDKKFKPFNCWPQRDCPGWPLKGYVQPADCDEIRIAKGRLHMQFKETAMNCYEAVQDRLESMYPGWTQEGCDLEGMLLIKEIPGDPRTQGNGDDIVVVRYTCGMVGLHFAVRCETGKIIVDENNTLGNELRAMAVEDFLIAKFQSETLGFDWDGDEHISIHTPDGCEERYAVVKDTYGNPTLVDEDTQEVLSIKII